MAVYRQLVGQALPDVALKNSRRYLHGLVMDVDATKHWFGSRPNLNGFSWA